MESFLVTAMYSWLTAMGVLVALVFFYRLTAALPRKTLHRHPLPEPVRPGRMHADSRRA